ncbi:unnamed protein product [Nippostrongylus brasiliensis]|uniref:Uncharacterized protein n=1 Tax=Nippostrongylus brasiliensis TaxID=27835 RepID=A0A0N4Y8M2_NIPBR|nr:unnamed protein product [Nippostrongylus brasiliensis]
MVSHLFENTHVRGSGAIERSAGFGGRLGECEYVDGKPVPGRPEPDPACTLTCGQPPPKAGLKQRLTCLFKQILSGFHPSLRLLSRHHARAAASRRSPGVGKKAGQIIAENEDDRELEP